MKNNFNEIKNEELFQVEGGANKDFIDGYKLGVIVRETILHRPVGPFGR